MIGVHHKIHFALDVWELISLFCSRSLMQSRSFDIHLSAVHVFRSLRCRQSGSKNFVRINFIRCKYLLKGVFGKSTNNGNQNVNNIQDATNTLVNTMWDHIHFGEITRYSTTAHQSY